MAYQTHCTGPVPPMQHLFAARTLLPDSQCQGRAWPVQQQHAAAQKMPQPSALLLHGWDSTERQVQAQLVQQQLAAAQPQASAAAALCGQPAPQQQEQALPGPGLLFQWHSQELLHLQKLFAAPHGAAADVPGVEQPHACPQWLPLQHGSLVQPRHPQTPLLCLLMQALSHQASTVQLLAQEACQQARPHHALGLSGALLVLGTIQQGGLPAL